MNNDLEIICKEAVVIEFEALSRHFPGRTEENHLKPVRIAGLQVEISNRDLPNRTREC
jgi:hypothetical protein